MRRIAVPVILMLTAVASMAPAAPVSPKGRILSYGRIERHYRREGGPAVNVTISDPILISEADKAYGWGPYCFPTVTRWTDGRLAVGWHMAEDATSGYGKAGGLAVSVDEGKSWAPYAGKRGASGLLLPNGDRISIMTPKPWKSAELTLPKPVPGRDNAYRLSELPEVVRKVYFTRWAKGATESVTESAELDDPKAIRTRQGDLFAVIWWGDVRLVKDGSLLAGIYPGYMLKDDGTMDPKGHVFFYRSTDNGRSWKIQGRVLYKPDPKADPMANERSGFTEPAFEVMADGSLLCVMRTTDWDGVGPMYASRSTDLGKTWTEPEAFTPNGVLPKLLPLDNGVLVLSSGRPGVQIRFSTDGHGRQWTEPFDLVPVTGGMSADSCGYTELLPTGPDRFLIVYTHFKHRTASGALRKAVMMREVVVRPARSAP